MKGMQITFLKTVQLLSTGQKKRGKSLHRHRYHQIHQIHQIHHHRRPHHPHRQKKNHLKEQLKRRLKEAKSQQKRRKQVKNIPKKEQEQTKEEKKGRWTALTKVAKSVANSGCQFVCEICAGEETANLQDKWY